MIGSIKFLFYIKLLISVNIRVRRLESFDHVLIIKCKQQLGKWASNNGSVYFYQKKMGVYIKILSASVKATRPSWRGVHWMHASLSELARLDSKLVVVGTLIFQPVTVWTLFGTVELRMPRPVQIDDPRTQPPKNDDVQDDDSSPVQPDDQAMVCKGDYINVPSHPYLKKILHKQGSE